MKRGFQAVGFNSVSWTKKLVKGILEKAINGIPRESLTADILDQSTKNKLWCPKMNMSGIRGCSVRGNQSSKSFPCWGFSNLQNHILTYQIRGSYTNIGNHLATVWKSGIRSSRQNLSVTLNLKTAIRIAQIWECLHQMRNGQTRSTEAQD